MEAFDLAFVFSNRDPVIVNLLLLIKVLSTLFHQFVTLKLLSFLSHRLSRFSTQTIMMRQCDEFKTSLNTRMHFRAALLT